MGANFRFDPLGPTQFPVGQGPFHARGLAYVAILKYIEGGLPGGREAFRGALAGDPFLPFFDQLFIVSGKYDVSPLVRLYQACAAIESKPVGRFVEERARSTAKSDTMGVWKPMLKATTPAQAAERTRLAFMRDFPGCQANVVASAPGRFEGELSGLPDCMTGMYTCSTSGFVDAAMSLVGAFDVKLAWDRPVPDGATAGVPTLKTRFAVTWSEGN